MSVSFKSRCDMGWSAERWQGLTGLRQRFGGRVEPPPKSVVTLRQVHGRRVRHIDDGGDAAEGDGLTTDRAGTLVGVWTADCVPVHLVAPRARVAAAVHCGWRGTALGMIPAALQFIEKRWNVMPREVEAALGPAIGACCYEVGEEVRSAFVARAGAGLGEAGFERREGRLHLDLRAFLQAEIQALGVESVERVGPCTGCRQDLLYSYRKQGKTGRQLSWVGWQD